MGLGKYSFYLGGVQLTVPPSNWQGLETLSTFVRTNDFDVREAETVQANITIDEFTFTNENAQTIIDYRKAGITGGFGVFEGLSFRIDVSDGTTTTILFNGFIDFKNNYREVSPVEVICKIKQLNSLNSFGGVISVNQFEYLESVGVYKQSDYVSIPFLVQRVDIEPELMTLEITLAMFTIQAAQLIKEITKDIGIVVAIASTVTGIPGSLVLAILILLADVLFLVVLLKQIVKVLLAMANLLAPPVKIHKGIFLDTLIEKAMVHLGYNGLNTTVEEFSKVAYLGHKGSGDGLITSGIPKIGEAMSDIFSMIGEMLKISNGRIAIIDNVVHIHTEESPFWRKNSTYQLPDVGNSDSLAMNLESEEVVLNTADFKGTTFIGFNSDGSDQWTLVDDEGTDTQIIRRPKTFSTDEKKLLLDGIEDVRIQLALGSRKSELNQVELILELIKNSVNKIIGSGNAIGGNQIGANSTGFPLPPPIAIINSILSQRKGALKISSKAFSVGKLIYLENQGTAANPDYWIPKNHREKFSAGVLYNKYHISNSFSSDNLFKRQRKLFLEREIPFNYNDFLKVNNNSYFTTFDGLNAKIESMKWKIDADTAIVDYWVEFIYTTNLTQVKIDTA